jgi:xanthine dehydrogenase accessory factor
MRLGLADEVLTRAEALRNRGQSFAVATVVRVEPPTSASPGDKALVTADGTLFGWIGGSCSEGLVRQEALIAISDGQPRLVKIAPETQPTRNPPPDGKGQRSHQAGVVSHQSTCPSAGALDVFIDPQLPRPLLLVVGGTPAARTLIRIGAAVGFRTCAVHVGAVTSDFPEADAVIGSLDPSSVPAGADTWAVVATMGHYDEDALAALLTVDLAYLGVIASRRRMRSVLDLLRGRGVIALDQIRRAGGDAVGRSQQEIALAVVAEIVAERHAREPAPALPRASTVDPVCGMAVDVEGALHTATVGSATYYFCGAHCREAFIAQPGRYLANTLSTVHRQP